MKESRAGTFVKQPAGYMAFIPKPLPPTPPLEYDSELRFALSEADRAVAKLGVLTEFLPNPDLFIAMYVKKEALLSSQIEGTEASLEGVLEFEADLKPKDNIDEIKEVINYIKAMNYGMEKVKRSHISLELIKEMHRVLIQGTRGSRRGLGEFRRSQNWVGPPGAALLDATFVPPPPDIVVVAMTELEQFVHAENETPPLVKAGLIHAQFETIHPFLDGNGRIGRLLITLYLFREKILSKPLLYLSFYLKKERTQYYDLLMRIRTEGAWEDWVSFFFRGITETSEEAVRAARDIIALKDSIISRLHENRVSSIHAVRLIDLLFDTPLTSVPAVAEKLAVSKQTAHGIVTKFNEMGILKEITGKERYRKYLFEDYVRIIAKGTEL